MNVQQPNGRIQERFLELKDNGRSALITFITAGDPDQTSSSDILSGLPEAGADLVEIGMPFSDPMADGPSIQLSSQRALKNGITVSKTLQMVRDFRKLDSRTPVVLMGYYNPIYYFGAEKFLKDAKMAGVDGLIVVDLPPEEEHELCLPAIKVGLDFIYLTAPTTDDARLPIILKRASGFIYFVSILGITGTKSADLDDVRAHVLRIKSQTELPIGVGFGIRTPEQARKIAKIADAVIVGSALVDQIRESLDSKGSATDETVENVLSLVSKLANGIRNA